MPSLADVKHVVILMQENRSFDHYYGTMSGVRGFGDRAAAQLGKGRSVIWQPEPVFDHPYALPFALTVFHQDMDCLPHTWPDEHAAVNGGRNDSWVAAKGAMTMGYFTKPEVPFHRALADAFTICDHYFCSTQAGTTPNRLHLFTGTIDADGHFGGPCKINPIGGDHTQVFSWKTYPERLQQKGIDWRVYANKEKGSEWLDDYGDNPLWLFEAYDQLQAHPPKDSLSGRAGVFNRNTQAVGPSNPTAEYVLKDFLSDCAAGTLPAVSWVVAPMRFSEHAPARPNDGARYTHAVLKAIWAKPELWKSTVVFVTYDENDGLFDHVVPPMPPDGTPGEFVDGKPVGLGPRVPMTIVSPWTRGGWVNSEVADHTSVLRFLEAWTGVKESNISDWRRKICGDLQSCFDFSTADTTVPTLAAPPLFPPGPLTLPPPPAMRRRPRQDSGSRPARPLPYALEAGATVAADSVWIDMHNAGKTAACLYVHPNAFRSDGPWRYTVDAGGTAKDNWVKGSPPGWYDLVLTGPNGFVRGFRGNRLIATAPGAANPQVHAQIDPAQDKLTLTLSNGGAGSCRITVISNLGDPTVDTLAPGEIRQRILKPGIAQNWYDIVATADTPDHFMRRFAGHVENGQPGVTDRFDRLRDDFAVDSWRGKWTLGWTSVVPFVLGSHQHLLEYKRDDGTVAIDRLKDDGSGTTEVWRKTWSKGWTSIVPFTLGGHPHLFEYKQDDGTVAIDRVNDDGHGTTEEWRGSWSKGWTAIVAFVLDGHPHLFEYKQDNGTVAIDRIENDAHGSKEIWRGKWTEGWTSLVPFTLGGRPHLFEYKQDDGTAAIDRIDGKTGTVEIWRGSWTHGWTSIVSLVFDGAPHLLSYKIGDGTAALDRLDLAGRGSEEIQRTTWTTGWTSIVPIVLRGRPGIVIYKKDEGTIAIDRFEVG